jgi:HEPN domain-containing protein
MKPNIEEALLSLGLADRDIKAFEVLSNAAGVHLSVVFFHAQQAVEKALKAALFTHQIEFGRTHDLIKLAQLLRGRGINVPVSDNQMRLLNPFAVTFRYDDMDIETISKEDAANMITTIRIWAEKMVETAKGLDEHDPSGHD